MPIAVRYTQDAFSRSGWLWPVDAKGEPLKATSYMAVGLYVDKYVNKKSDMDLAAKGLGAKEWNNALKTKFFFSSRRRHTISLRDWSSDVCSSDLGRVHDLACRLIQYTVVVSLQPDSDSLFTYHLHVPQRTSDLLASPTIVFV